MYLPSYLILIFLLSHTSSEGSMSEELDLSKYQIYMSSQLVILAILKFGYFEIYIKVE